ncbi:hypothetical protein [Methylobacterium sp. 1973]|jgi:hypothetical protein|uniref:hypothetical protein n=1 Tax=Methylobacterium sp. 1973 TaxID=3156421 RepID=UPI003398E0C3
MPMSDHAAKKRLQRQKAMALQIAVQLPVDQAEALALLADVKWLVENFMVYEEDCVSSSEPKRFKIVGA